MSDLSAFTVEDFALQGLHLGKMTGVSVATHAIPDAFLLMHTGVGCKYKTAAQVANHDWGSHPNQREGWTQVAELQLIKGSSERIGPFVRTWYERRRPAYMCVVSAYFIELTGEDFSDAVLAAEKTVPCDMSLIKTAAPNKGFFDGYACVMEEVLAKQDWRAEPTEPDQASVVGFFFHRYEPDQVADLSQLEVLVNAGGLKLGPVLFSGQPYAKLMQASASRVVLQLPYVGPKARKVKRIIKKRDHAVVDLPIGMAASTRFVRDVAAVAGADMDKVEAWIAAERASVEAELNKVADHFRNVRLAVFADAPLAAGLVSLFHEMGIATPIVGLRDQHNALGGRTAFFETLERNGITDYSRMEVVQSPSLRWTRATCLDGMNQGRLSGIVASSHELDMFTHLPISTAAQGHTFLLETGFPSDRSHTSFPTPTLGFEGAKAWTQRVLTAKHAYALAFDGG